MVFYFLYSLMAFRGVMYYGRTGLVACLLSLRKERVGRGANRWGENNETARSELGNLLARVGAFGAFPASGGWILKRAALQPAKLARRRCGRGCDAGQCHQLLRLYCSGTCMYFRHRCIERNSSVRFASTFPFREGKLNASQYVALSEREGGPCQPCQQVDG